MRSCITLRVTGTNIKNPYLVGIELGSHGQDDLATGGVPLGQRHQIAVLEDLVDGRVGDVQLLEPLREELADGQVALEHFAGGRNGELLGPQEAQQEDGVRAALPDVRMLLDPLPELGQSLPPDVLVLVQLLLGHLLHRRTESADIWVVVVRRRRSAQLRLLQHLRFEH